MNVYCTKPISIAQQKIYHHICHTQIISTENIMNGIKRLILDVLKLHNPSIIEMADAVGRLPGVDGVNVSLYEVDQQTENVKVTVEGEGLEFDQIKEVIEHFGAAIHSIDEVASGRRLVEEIETLQERT